MTVGGRAIPPCARITAQLIEAQTGSHLWAESDQRPVTTKNILAIQQDIASSIAAAIGGDAGIVLSTEFRQSRHNSTANLTAYECFLQYQAWMRSNSVEQHAPIRDCLEQAVRVDPNYANAWAALAVIYVEEDRLGYNPRPGSLDRALHAAQRAVELAPDNQLAQHNLAFTHFFRGERDAFLAAGDRAVQLNPNEPTTLAEIGL